MIGSDLLYLFHLCENRVGRYSRYYVLNLIMIPYVAFETKSSIRRQLDPLDRYDDLAPDDPLLSIFHSVCSGVDRPQWQRTHLSSINSNTTEIWWHHRTFGLKPPYARLLIDNSRNLAHALQSICQHKSLVNAHRPVQQTKDLDHPLPD